MVQEPTSGAFTTSTGVSLGVGGSQESNAGAGGGLGKRKNNNNDSISEINESDAASKKRQRYNKPTEEIEIPPNTDKTVLEAFQRVIDRIEGLEEYIDSLEDYLEERENTLESVSSRLKVIEDKMKNSQRIERDTTKPIGTTTITTNRFEQLEDQTMNLNLDNLSEFPGLNSNQNHDKQQIKTAKQPEKPKKSGIRVSFSH
jgi:hypothetical protein